MAANLSAPSPELPALLTVKEAAVYLRVSESVCYDMVRTGRIRGVKFGAQWRIQRKALERLIETGLA